MIALLCFFLNLFASPFKSKSRLEAENAALRHQLEGARSRPTHEEQTITIREPDTAAHLPPQYDELMSERSALCLKSALRLERRDKEGQAEAEQRDDRR